MDTFLMLYGVQMAATASTGSGGGSNIPKVKKIDVLLQIYADYNQDFLSTFAIGGGGAVQCTAVHIPRFEDFAAKWTTMFLQHDMVIGALNLQQPTGDRSQVTNASNHNRKVLAVLFGAAFQVYLKSCKMTNQQPHAQYSLVTVIEFE